MFFDRKSGKVRALLPAIVALSLLAMGIVVKPLPTYAGQPTEVGVRSHEIRIGVLQHDLNGYGGSETGLDAVIEWRGPSLPPINLGWDILLRLRPHIGANINTGDATSSLYAGLTWMVPIRNAYYLSADFGGAIHNGHLDNKEPDRAALGSRILFREAVEIGRRIAERWRVGLRIDHISNADLAYPNDGITNIGPVVTTRF